MIQNLLMTDDRTLDEHLDCCRASTMHTRICVHRIAGTTCGHETGLQKMKTFETERLVCLRGALVILVKDRQGQASPAHPHAV